MTSFSPAMRENPFSPPSSCHRRQDAFNLSASDAETTAMRAYLTDIIAFSFFVLEWTVYAITLEHSDYGKNSLSSRMNVFREVWMRRMLDREARMVDMQIMGSLQNGTAFFA